MLQLRIKKVKLSKNDHKLIKQNQKNHGFDLKHFSGFYMEFEKVFDWKKMF